MHKKTMRRHEAVEVDTDRYVEFDAETNMHCVFGNNSGFAYSCHSDKPTADEDLDAWRKTNVRTEEV